MSNRVNVIRTPEPGSASHAAISLRAIRDEALSWEARGVLLYLLTLPPGKEVTALELQQGCGRDKIYRILRELKNAGYIFRERYRTPSGRFKYGEYRVYEAPFTENPYTVKPDPVKAELNTRSIALSLSTQKEKELTPTLPGAALEPTDQDPAIKGAKTRVKQKEVSIEPEPATGEIRPHNPPAAEPLDRLSPPEPLEDGYYPVTGAQVNEMIAVWYDWAPCLPTRYGKPMDAKAFYPRKAVREAASGLIRRGATAGDMIEMLRDIRIDPNSPLSHYKAKELPFITAAKLLEGYIEANETRYYSADMPRIVERKPGIRTDLGAVDEPQFIERLYTNPDLIVEVPPAWISLLSEQYEDLENDN